MLPPEHQPPICPVHGIAKALCRDGKKNTIYRCRKCRAESRQKCRQNKTEPKESANFDDVSSACDRWLRKNEDPFIRRFYGYDNNNSLFTK